MSTQLNYKHYWVAPGYRDVLLVMVDPLTLKEYELRLAPADVQRLIFGFADATKQIGTEPPIDWDAYPTQIAWPQVTPWRAGPRKRASTL